MHYLAPIVFYVLGRALFSERVLTMFDELTKRPLLPAGQRRLQSNLLKALMGGTILAFNMPLQGAVRVAFALAVAAVHYVIEDRFGRPGKPEIETKRVD